MGVEWVNPQYLLWSPSHPSSPLILTSLKQSLATLLMIDLQALFPQHRPPSPSLPCRWLLETEKRLGGGGEKREGLLGEPQVPGCSLEAKPDWDNSSVSFLPQERRFQPLVFHD